MAVPTFSSINPGIGHTAGRVVVEIVGTNFQLPTIPDHGPVPGPVPKTVRVLFGDVPAELVEVVTASRLFVTTPIHDPGAVAVTIQNLDADGVPIAGEDVLSPDAVYSFMRPTLTGEPVNESDLQRLVRTLVLELRRQIVDGVTISENTDYDPDTGAEISVINVPSFPHIVLIGPTLKENRFYSVNDPPDFEDEDGNFVERKVPKTYDVFFNIIGVSNRRLEMLNLMHVTANFFRDNTELRMNLSATDPSKGYREFELDLTEDGGFAANGKANNSNVQSFSGRCMIRGFDIETVSGIASTDGAGFGVSAETVNARGFITDQKGAVLDPVEKLGIASSPVAPLVVRAILSPGD